MEHVSEKADTVQINGTNNNYRIDAGIRTSDVPHDIGPVSTLLPTEPCQLAQQVKGLRTDSRSRFRITNSLTKHIITLCIN